MSGIMRLPLSRVMVISVLTSYAYREASGAKLNSDDQGQLENHALIFHSLTEHVVTINVNPGGNEDSGTRHALLLTNMEWKRSQDNIMRWSNKTVSYSERTIQRVENNAGRTMQRVENNAGRTIQRVENNAGRTIQRVENNAGRTTQRVENNAGRTIQRVENNATLGRDRSDEAERQHSSRLLLLSSHAAGFTSSLMRRSIIARTNHLQPQRTPKNTQSSSSHNGEDVEMWMAMLDGTHRVPERADDDPQKAKMTRNAIAAGERNVDGATGETQSKFHTDTLYTETDTTTSINNSSSSSAGGDSLLGIWMSEHNTRNMEHDDQPWWPSHLQWFRPAGKEANGERMGSLERGGVAGVTNLKRGSHGEGRDEERLVSVRQSDTIRTSPGERAEGVTLGPGHNEQAQTRLRTIQATSKQKQLNGDEKNYPKGATMSPPQDGMQAVYRDKLSLNKVNNKRDTRGAAADKAERVEAVQAQQQQQQEQQPQQQQQQQQQQQEQQQQQQQPQQQNPPPQQQPQQQQQQQQYGDEAQIRESNKDRADSHMKPGLVRTQVNDDGGVQLGVADKSDKKMMKNSDEDHPNVSPRIASRGQVAQGMDHGGDQKQQQLTGDSQSRDSVSSPKDKAPLTEEDLTGEDLSSALPIMVVTTIIVILLAIITIKLVMIYQERRQEEIARSGPPPMQYLKPPRHSIK